MGKGCLAAVLLCLVPLLILPEPAPAMWVENGKAVCTAIENQDDPLVIPDGSGGSIIVWMDYRSTTLTEVYAQRVDEFGNDMWTSGGVPVYSGTNSAQEIYMTGDGASGAFIAVLGAANTLFVQRLYADGTTWSSPEGILACNFAFIGIDIEYASIAHTGEGGVIVTWVDFRSFPDLNIYAQRVDPSGAVKWVANGVPVCSAANFQMSVACVPDLDGGAIIAWADERSGVKDLYAQRIDSAGTVLWAADGVPVCTETDLQQRPYGISDGAGGAIISWEDNRTANGGDIYLQKLDPSGAAQWTTNGVSATSEPSTEARIVSDGEGGAIVTWLDVRNLLPNTDIYAQRVNSAGDVLWDTDGTAICTTDDLQDFPSIAEDGAGGAVIVWQDTRNSTHDIYAQRIGPDGVVMWEENGDSVCTGQTGSRHMQSIACIGRRGVVIAWEDSRNGETDYNIYAQGLDLQGNWGYPSPVIHSVEDVPGDQGGYVNLFWYASIWEDLLYDEITHYTLWRAVEPQQAMSALDMGAALIENPGDLDLEDEDRVIRLVETGTATYFWELVGTQQAYRFEAYAVAIPTLFDSTEVYHACHYFQVLAHRSDQDYYASGIDSAYSVDNLSPAVPMGLAAEQLFDPVGLLLTWDANAEGDLAGYTVYRGTSADFVPSEGNRIGTPAQPNLFDDAWTWDAGYWYKVVAVDVHGNEGEYAELSPDMVTGDDTPVPDVAFLTQNFPNPFNPATTITFGLKKRGHVSLRIYDAAGRLVDTLADEVQPAGRYEVVWNGSDGNGNTVASGIYFYRLVTGDFVQTKKMVLLR